MRIAVIGAGVSGLIAARMLHDAGRSVTLYEAAPRLGGHAHTIDVGYADGAQPVDIGFIVYNERNYPNLTRLFASLGVPTKASDMSFSASLDDGALEYAGSARGWFAQPANLLRPRFWGMTADVLRFFRSAKHAARAPDETRSLGVWLRDEGYGAGFVEDHLLPMAAAIWSCPCETMLDFPARSFLKFFDNHALLEWRDRPRWRTVAGGSRVYVEALSAPLAGLALVDRPVARVLRVEAGVEVTDRRGETRRFDAVVLATHGDQARALLGDPDRDEKRVLDGFRTQANEVILHSDARLMPKRRRAWAAWNYIASREDGARRVSVTYWMNALQGIDESRPLFVSLNPQRAPDAALTHGRWPFAHPVFDQAAITAQAELPAIQGRNRVYWCGAWTGYGFHEDGLASGMAAARALGGIAPWEGAAAGGAGRAAA